MIGGLTIEVEIPRDEVSPMTHRYLEIVKDRTPMNMAVGEGVRDLVRDYLITVTGSTHATAERLGAEPTGHWGRAAETLSFSATEETAIVTIHDPAASLLGNCFCARRTVDGQNSDRRRGVRGSGGSEGRKKNGVRC